MEDKTTPLAVALSYFNAWRNKDFDKAADYLSPDITFDMPINSYDTREKWMEAVRFTAMNITDLTMLSQFGNEGDSLLLYDITFPAVGKIRLAEYFKVAKGKITKICHIHDTAALRKAGFDRDGV